MDELNDLGFSEKWLKQQLKNKNISSFNDVFLAEWLEGDGLFVQTFDKS
ncbi:YetF domain-containing protein [Metabacillus fastidiosus]